MTEKELQLILRNQQIIMNQNSEIVWANVFHDTIKGSKWLSPDFAFSPGRGAVGYPALYAMYRILNEIHPRSILECGMGQSTKMFGEYAKYNQDAKHCVVEHDDNWINFFSGNYDIPGNTEIVSCGIVDSTLEVDGTASNVTMYTNFEEQLKGRVFDMIFIDGPYGFRSPLVSRIDIVSLLPECLAEQFVIMLDDMDRQGEKTCFELLKQKITAAGIKIAATEMYQGEKVTGMITSENLSFLCTM